MDLIADTTLLIGLWRKQRWAMDFAGAHGSSVLWIPWIVLGEFWHGAIRAGHDEQEVARFLELGTLLLDPEPVVQAYGKICAAMQEEDARSYREIGQNDLWIAAVAIHHDRPLVSRNRRHFGKISELKLIIPDGE